MGWITTIAVHSRKPYRWQLKSTLAWFKCVPVVRIKAGLTPLLSPHSPALHVRFDAIIIPDGISRNIVEKRQA